MADRHTFPIAVEQRGLQQGPPADPCIMVIFGATGDLTRRELIPSLFELHAKGLLPAPFAVIGFSQGAWDTAAFREHMRRAVEVSCGHLRTWDAFAERLSFVRGDVTSAPGDAYAALSGEIARVQTSSPVQKISISGASSAPSVSR